MSPNHIHTVIKTTIKFDLTKGCSTTLENLDIFNIDRGTIIIPGKISRAVSIIQVSKDSKTADDTASEEIASLTG